MDNTFKLIVFSGVALALIAAFFVIMGMDFFPNPALETLREQLKTAQAQPGSAIGETISFPAGSTVSGKAFAATGRTVAVECNSAAHCCPKGQACGNAIEWEQDSLHFTRNMIVPVHARCSMIARQFACTTYVGEKPAQLAIARIENRETYDLRSGLPVIRVLVENTGNLPAFAPVVSARISVLFVQDEREKKERAEELDTSSSLSPLSPGERRETDLILNTAREGRFEAEISVHGEHAGEARQTLVFSMVQSQGNCRADTGKESDLFFIEPGICGKRYYCSDCKKASECAEQWFGQNNRELEIGNSGYAFERVTCS